jgi:hypothetical protein
MTQSREIRWTPELRAALFAQLVERYGPLSEWEHRETRFAYPGRGLDTDYVAFTAAFALLHGAKSDRAVRMQVECATRINSRDTAAYNARVIGAALGAGFLTTEEAMQRLTDLSEHEAAA